MTFYSLLAVGTMGSPIRWDEKSCMKSTSCRLRDIPRLVDISGRRGMLGHRIAFLIQVNKYPELDIPTVDAIEVNKSFHNILK